MNGRAFPRIEIVLLAMFVFTYPLVVYVSTLPVARFRNEITQWGNVDTVAYKQFVDYREKFGTNEFIVVTWPGCDLEDERVSIVSGRIQEELAGSVAQISDGPSVYWTFRDETGITDAAARKRMRGLFIGEDSDSTAIAFSLTPAARKDRAAVVAQVMEILKRSDVDPQQASFAGLGHNLYTLDKEGLESPFRMVPQILLLAFVMSIVFLRHFGLALFVNALGVYAGCLSFNFIYLADIDLNAIVWPLPTLTMLLTVSAALHFLSYYSKAIVNVGLSSDDVSHDDDSLPYARRITFESLKLSWKPMLFCAITTAIGLLSLQLSTSSPVRQFGLYGGISIVTAIGLTLLWLPMFLTVIRYGAANRRSLLVAAERRRSEEHSLIVQRAGWGRLAWFTGTFRWPIIIVSLIGLVVMAAGVPKIKTGSNVHNFFPEDHQVLKDVTAIEQATGPLSSVELLLRFKNPNDRNDRSRLNGLRALSSKIVSDTSVHNCISAATFSPVWKKGRGAIQYAADFSRIRKLKQQACENGLLHVVPESNELETEDAGNLEETWRISCRYFDAGQQGQSVGTVMDLPQLCESLRSITNEVFYRDEELVYESESLEVITTGEFVLFEEVDRQFFSELMKTYLTAFVLISIVVLCVLRTPVGLLLALPPNLFPAVIVLGAAGHFGYSLDAASLMTASVALGIAVDDTLHFMLWWKESLAGNATDEIAIERAMRYSGTAMVQTSFILGLSIVLYAFCGFLPTVRFGLLLCGMMLVALIGDLILLPALLATQSKPRVIANDGNAIP